MLYEEAVTYIESIPKFASKNTLETTAYFLATLGNPQDSYKVIHIAGTNGKGSTCAYLNAMLLSMDKKVGMFTSPHLIEITERIRINDKDIEKEKFLDLFHIVYEQAKELEKEGIPHPSFFEFIMIMALIEFKRSGMEYVILETGLGGRFDSTNVIKQPIVTIITSIGLDHEQYLGSTVKEVAYQKAGIIKSDCPLIYDDISHEVTEVIEKEALYIGVKCRKISDYAYEIMEKSSKHIAFSLSDGYDIDTSFVIPNKGSYQIRNTILAIAAMLELFGTEYLVLWKEALSNVYWPGRMEEVQPNIYVDGAHNIPAIQTLVSEIPEIDYLLYGAVEDKNYPEIIKEIISGMKVNQIVVTNLENPRGVPVHKLEEIIKNCGQRVVKNFNTVGEAMEHLVNKKEEEKVLCIGSLYLVGEIMDYLHNHRG